jgi:hypothetical protein
VRIISENTPEQLAQKREEQAQQEAMNEVRRALIELAANLLRVTRGAGRAYELGEQAQRFAASLLAYHKLVGCFPGEWDLSEFIRLDSHWQIPDSVKGDMFTEQLALQSVVKGSLQITASRMLGQNAQTRSGETEFHEGIQHLEAIWKERRAAWSYKTPKRISRKWSKPILL